MDEIEKINSLTIKEALKNIEANKSDSTYEFFSDFLKHGPEVIHEH